MSQLSDAIIAMRQNERLPGAEIARRLGCNKAWVSQVLANAGLRPAPVKRPGKGEHKNKFCSDGSNLKDPNRADKLLRRFSWQEPMS